MKGWLLVWHRKELVQDHRWQRPPDRVFVICVLWAHKASGERKRGFGAKPSCGRRDSKLTFLKIRSSLSSHRFILLFNHSRCLTPWIFYKAPINLTHILSRSTAAFWENDELWGLTSRTLEAKNPKAAKVLSGFQTRELFHLLTPVFWGALLGFEHSNTQVISLCLSSCEHVCVCCVGECVGRKFMRIHMVWSHTCGFQDLGQD